jgi:hypothetical protein
MMSQRLRRILTHAEEGSEVLATIRGTVIITSTVVVYQVLATTVMKEIDFEGRLL